MRSTLLAVVMVTMMGVSPVLGEEPVTVNVGDASVDGRFIVAYKNAWKMTMRSADGSSSPVGRWTDEVELVEIDGRTAIKRTRKIYSAQDGLLRTWINTVDHKTLAPIKSETHAGDDIQRVAYDGAKATIRTGQAKTEGSASQAAFDWQMYGLLLVGFPLEEGYEARFPAFQIPNDGSSVGTQWITLKVTGTKKVIAGKKGELETFVVEVRQPEGLYVFYLTKQDPYIIRLENRMGDGQTMVFEME